MKYCRKCGKELDDKTSFCPSCGTQISENSNLNENNDNKKIIIILGAVLAAIVIICATIIVIFATKDNNKEKTTTQVTTVATSNPNINDKNRLNSLYERYGDANVKAEKKGVNVKKEKKVAKASLERYKIAIDNNDTSVLGEYAKAAEKDVSKLESATNKMKKNKKKNKAKANRIPASEMTNYKLAPNYRLTKDMDYPYVEYAFGSTLMSDEEYYCACIIAKNEIYAQNGCHLSTPQLQEYFEHQSWYIDEGKAPKDKYLSSEELHNAQVLNKEKTKYKYLDKYKTGRAKDFDYDDYMAVGAKCSYY